jgi:hypothetical protein
MYGHGHALLGSVAFSDYFGHDGGPRGYRRRGSALPEKYLPGRFLMSMRQEDRADVVNAVNAAPPPAPWFLRALGVDEAEHRVSLPPPPADQRWSCRGRWSMPPSRKERR